MDLLADKVAIVAGASSGIGYATARLFAAEGAKVVVGARRQALLDALVADIVAAASTSPSTTPAPLGRWETRRRCQWRIDGKPSRPT